jgi:hypothetical protein
MIIAKTAAAVIVVAAIAAGCGGAHRIAVTSDGRVGTLAVDRSTRADVVSFAGRPDAETRRRQPYGTAHFDALGYGCRGSRAVRSDGLPACVTVFYVATPSDRLEEFYTQDPRYALTNGVRPGMPIRDAERRAHEKVPTVGCLRDWAFTTPHAVVWVLFGDRTVDFVLLMSRKRSAGVFDCLDS